MSDTDDEMASAMNEILSGNSFLKGNARGYTFGGDALVSPPIGIGSPPAGAPHEYGSVGTDNLKFNGAILGELATQKQKFGKKVVQLERTIEQLRSEKSQLSQILESQRQNFKFALAQQESKSAQIIKDLKDSQKLPTDMTPAFQEKLELYKQELGTHQLLISEEAYIDLRTKQNQSLKEFI